MAAPDCSRCPNRVFNYAKSKSHRNGTSKDNNGVIEIGNERLIIKGFSSKDVVCFYFDSPQYCFPDFEFFTVDKIEKSYWNDPDIQFDQVSG